MKQIRFVPFLLALGILLGGTWGVVWAQAPTPSTPVAPPRVPDQPAPRAETVSSPSHLSGLPPLKAVLVVGPIDGDYGPWTTREKAHMDLAAAELEAHSVAVQKFYTPNNDWAAISAASEGAHFFLYRGHGVYWSPMPSPAVGGLALHNMRNISPDEIRNDLRLAPNAIVMLYGCFTAGSSSLDDSSISGEEAERRVAEYSNPFFDTGVAGYYANWFGDAFQMFVRYLFQGMTLRQAYESFYDFNSSTVERHPGFGPPGSSMWLDKDYWSDRWQYNNAFVGLPDRTLEDLFGGTGQIYEIYLPMVVHSAP